MTDADPVLVSLADRLVVLGSSDRTARVQAATESYRSSLRPPVAGQSAFRTAGTGAIQPLLDEVLGDNHVVATRVSAGSATRWHTHDCDQVLIVTGGVATVETDQGATRAEAGTVIFIPSGLPHLHGSLPDSFAETVYLTATGHSTEMIDGLGHDQGSVSEAGSG